jgi:iduronate 2-sulfatase
MRPLFLLSLITSPLFTSPLFALDQAPPNVLFIAVDDLRPELGCFGRDYIKSPHIDALSKRGTTFFRAYCQQATCSPSRTSLMTGLRPDTTKVYDLSTHFRNTVPDAVTLPQHFKAHGYHTVGIGKIYHGGLDDGLSWSVPSREKVGGKFYQLKENEAPPRPQRPRNPDGSRAKIWGAAMEFVDAPDDAYEDGAIAAEAVKALDQLAKKSEPFFLAVGFYRPHLPFVAPKKYWNLYDEASITLPQHPKPPLNMPNLARTGSGEITLYKDMPDKAPFDDQLTRALRHGYYASVSFTDAQIGRVLTKLDDLGLRENTIVVLWSDHGWKLGEYGMWSKHTNFELDANTPLIVSDPRIKSPPASTHALVELVDIYPTLCDLTNLPKCGTLEGASFAPLLSNPEKPWKKAAFSQFPRGQVMGYTMKTHDARLTLWVSRNNPQKIVATELYDHIKDPQETHNIAGNPDQAHRVESLIKQLRAGWRDALPPS